MMSVKNTSLMMLVAAGAVISTATFAATTNSAKVNLAAPENFGFTHIESIEFEQNGQLEVEGWGADGWYLEAEFDGATVLEEKRQRTIVQPWGLTFAQLNQVLELAKQDGILRVTELEIQDDGRIEVEGRNDRDRKVELNIMVNNLAE